MSPNDQLLTGVTRQFRQTFPDNTLKRTHGVETLTASSRTGIIELEIKQQHFILSSIYVGWMMSVICSRNREDIMDHTLFSISYGPGTDKRFHYPRFLQFCMQHWPRLLTILPDGEGNVPSYGIRELIFIPEEQRWDPNAPFMMDCLTELMQAVKTYVYK